MSSPRRLAWRRCRYPFAVLTVAIFVACWNGSGGGQGAGRAMGAAPATFRIVDPDETREPSPGEKAPARKYDTFAHRVLDIDFEEAPVAAAKYAWLDSVIDDARRRVTLKKGITNPTDRRREAVRVLEIIDDVLTDHNVLYPPAGYDVDSLRSGLAPQRYDKVALERVLHSPINKRRRAHARAHADEPFYILDCDTSSFVYVGIADALGLDLCLVDLPDHMFVRVELGEGKHLNWDTNDAAAVVDDEYARDYGLDKRLRRKRVYLSTMTRRESEGFAYFLRASRFEDRNQDARAIADLEKARALYPQSTQIWSELAWLYATAAGVDVNHRKEALELARAALDLEPQCGDFWDSLAAAHGANGNFKRAVECAREAEVFAEGNEERGEFRSHRKAFEAGRMPGSAKAAKE